MTPEDLTLLDRLYALIEPDEAVVIAFARKPSRTIDRVTARVAYLGCVRLSVSAGTSELALRCLAESLERSRKVVA